MKKLLLLALLCGIGYAGDRHKKPVLEIELLLLHGIDRSTELKTRYNPAQMPLFPRVAAEHSCTSSDH